MDPEDLQMADLSMENGWNHGAQKICFGALNIDRDGILSLLPGEWRRADCLYGTFIHKGFTSHALWPCVEAMEAWSFKSFYQVLQSLTVYV